VRTQGQRTSTPALSVACADAHARGTLTSTVDYLAGRHPFPYHISCCGDFDIVGHAKPQSIYRRVLWGVDAIGMLVHGPTTHAELPRPWAPGAFNWDWPMELDSWTWTGAEGELVGVRVFARACEYAALSLNGTRLGVARFHENFTALFTVPYRPGTLAATCLNSSTAVPHVSTSLTTAGEAVALSMSADRPHIAHDADDLAYVTVAVVDASGRRVPTAAVPVTLRVSGVGRLLAVGSGDPSDPGSFEGPTRTTWRGRAVAVLQPLRGAAGSITVTAVAAGLASASIVVVTQDDRVAGGEGGTA
jgi:beta-galactosidase